MKIDIVIPWCGNDFDPTHHTTHEDWLRQANNDELYYCLDSIKTFAPWVNKIYILVNKIEVPDYIPEPKKTIFIDRTTLFNGKQTTNGLVAETLSWKIPELSEYFILAHDDVILGRKTQISDFFEDSKPIYYHYVPSWGSFRGKVNHRIYLNESVFKDRSPLSCGPYPHFYIPMRKSFCEKIESEYDEWFKFMRSHTDKRFDSRNSEYTMEEDFKGVFISYIARNKLGIDKSKFKYSMGYEFGFIEHKGKCYDTRMSRNVNDYIPCQQSIKRFKDRVMLRKEPPLFVNFNSVQNKENIDEVWEFVKYEKYKS